MGNASNPSIFTKIINREVPADIVQETDDLIVIKDINPKAPIHLLIVPKKPLRDVRDFSADDLYLAGKMFAMAQHLAKTVPGAQEFRLIISNGYSAGQRVFHTHMHFLAGKQFTE